MNDNNSDLKVANKLIKDKTNNDSIENKRRLSKNRRRNAKIYPIYKMFSWDLLVFYSIEFLFYTITKKVTASEILIINGLYLFFGIIMQIPAVAISDYIGKKKSIVFGNMLNILFSVFLIFVPGVAGIILADLAFSLGNSIKVISESNLLYDSVATKRGDSLYAKLDSMGGSLYYILDGVASIAAGYLFNISNYLPIIICLSFSIISTIISLGFKDIYANENKKSEKAILSSTFKNYSNDLKECMGFIIKSRRMKAFIIFNIVFTGLIDIADIYNGDLLVDIGINNEQFSIIFALIILIGGFSISLRKNIEKKFKNRTLSFLSLIFVLAMIIIGTISFNFKGNQAIIPIILIMFVIMRISLSNWYILEYKYLKNFTKEEMRNKITFTYEFIGKIGVSVISILGGLLLNIVNIEQAFLLVGLIGLILITLVLDYMRTRFGLKPNEYKNEDINFDK